MKKIKLLSIVTAAMMSVSVLFGTVSVSADNGITETPDKIYTLEELFAMNDEEFFSLENAELMYDEIKDDAENDKAYGDADREHRGISGNLSKGLCLEDENVIYTANITEMKIEELLGDSVEYTIVSPISLDTDYILNNSLYYGDILWVVFPEYRLDAKKYNITHKEIIEFAKCYYCVNQVIEIGYYHYDWILSSAPSNEQVIEGDVNFDKKIDLQDVIWLSKGLVKQFKLTDAQLIIADVNKDGVVNVFDAILISRKLFKK